MTIYVSIGNSDDKLSQLEWSAFAGQVQALISSLATQIHGVWFSPSGSAFQNACFCFELASMADAQEVKTRLARLAGHYRQDSIAWAEATTEFIKGVAG